MDLRTAGYLDPVPNEAATEGDSVVDKLGEADAAKCSGDSEGSQLAQVALDSSSPGSTESNPEGQVAAEIVPHQNGNYTSSGTGDPALATTTTIIEGEPEASSLERIAAKNRFTTRKRRTVDRAYRRRSTQLESINYNGVIQSRRFPYSRPPRTSASEDRGRRSRVLGTSSVRFRLQKDATRRDSVGRRPSYFSDRSFVSFYEPVKPSTAPPRFGVGTCRNGSSLQTSAATTHRGTRVSGTWDDPRVQWAMAQRYESPRPVGRSARLSGPLVIIDATAMLIGILTSVIVSVLQAVMGTKVWAAVSFLVFAACSSSILLHRNFTHNIRNVLWSSIVLILASLAVFAWNLQLLIRVKTQPYPYGCYGASASTSQVPDARGFRCTTFLALLLAVVLAEAAMVCSLFAVLTCALIARWQLQVSRTTPKGKEPDRECYAELASRQPLAPVQQAVEPSQAPMAASGCPTPVCAMARQPT